MNPLLQEVEDFINSKFTTVKQVNTYMLGDLSSIIPDMRDNFNLAFLGCGISRTVFKEKYSRKVIKIGAPRHNLSENYFHGLVVGSNIEGIFAECYGTSKNGLALEQEYTSKLLVNMGSYSSDAELDEILKFRSFYKGSKYIPVYDMHDSNIGIKTNGDLKIIDYSMIIPFNPLKLPSKKEKKELQKFINSNFTSKVAMYLDMDLNLVISDSNTRVVMKNSNNEPSTENSMD